MVLIGIDLGNQFCSVAISRNNIKEYLTIDGNITFPTALTFIDNNILLGKIEDVDAIIVSDLLKLLLTKTITVKLPNKTKIYYTQELMAIFLDKIKTQCETYFKVNVDTALLTVSASLNTVEKNAILDGALLAGINIAFANVNEVHLKSFENDNNNWIAIHFGTYLTEVLIQYPSQKRNFFISIGGNTFDKKIMDHLNIGQIEAEKIKKILTHSNHALMTRAKFEDIYNDTFKLLNIFLDTLDIKIVNPDKIIVSGNTYKIPKIKQLLSTYENVIFVEDPAIFLNESYNVSNVPITLNNTISVGVAGGISYPVIKSGCELPATNTLTFTTYNDNQDEILLDIICGSRIFNRDNQLLARFPISNIPRSSRGNERIELIFNVDVNCVFRVTSKIVSTGKTDHITISIPDTEVNNSKKNKDTNDINELILLETKQKMESIIGLLKQKLGDDKRLEGLIIDSNDSNDLDQLKQKITECSELWKRI